MKVDEKKLQVLKGMSKEICPLCKVEYLENSYANKKRKWIKVGKFCPNENCTYSRKDMKKEE